MPKKIQKKYWGPILSLVSVGIIFGTFLYAQKYHFPLLEPSGWVGEQQKNLIIFTMLLSLIVVVPVFYLLFRFINQYDESNKKSKYDPELDSNKKLEFVWWGVPILLILLLGTITYKTSHSLDPYRALKSDNKPLTVQVVALQWKWLFIYPEENVATINYLKVPVNRPIEFKITADAPMNSFWIPDLGGQVYAMSGMTTELNLVANKLGEYKGLSSNLSGEGFAGMKFVVSAVGDSEYQTWLYEKQSSEVLLDDLVYEELVYPSSNNTPTFYRTNDGFFDKIVSKYNTHEEFSGHEKSEDHYMEGM